MKLEMLKQLQPEEFAMRERLRDAMKSGNTDRLPWWQAGVNRVLEKGTSETYPNYRFVISSSSTDRAGDIVRPDGMDNKNFRTNPVVLYNHDDWKNLPIGVSLEERVIPNERVEGTMVFDLENDPQGLANAVKGKLDKGHLSATSIRFSPFEYEMIMETVEMRGGPEDVWTGGFDFMKWELLEWSIVSIPCNPDCVRRAYGVLTDGVKSDQDEVIRGLVGKLVKSEVEPFLAQLADLKLKLERFEASPASAPQIANEVAHQLALQRCIAILREVEPVTNR